MVYPVYPHYIHHIPWNPIIFPLDSHKMFQANMVGYLMSHEIFPVYFKYIPVLFPFNSHQMVCSPTTKFRGYHRNPVSLKDTLRCHQMISNVVCWNIHHSSMIFPAINLHLAQGLPSHFPATSQLATLMTPEGNKDDRDWCRIYVTRSSYMGSMWYHPFQTYWL